MLRDLPPFGSSEHNDDAFFMTVPGTQHETSAADLDDVFGSAPTSPVIPDSSQDEVATQDSQQHPSDIPRLRSTHVTAGYREGLSRSKDQHIQSGFDEGYALGAELGFKAGWCLGVLEGILRAGGDVGALWREAQRELDMRELLTREYFGEDGIWRYDVGGEEEEEDVTFSRVADAHPVVVKWSAKVRELAESFGLEVQ